MTVRCRWVTLKKGLRTGFIQGDKYVQSCWWRKDYMSKNIIMKGVGAYIPPNKVYNDEIDEHFEQRGLSAHSLMKNVWSGKALIWISYQKNGMK